MKWNEDLLAGQVDAACHNGTHARLLAGPGTGKTLSLTRRVCYLIDEKKVEPCNILVLTFTRAATRELRQRIAQALGEENSPYISTLHSFALRQLLQNSGKIDELPQPLRIADDWEERQIIMEDLKKTIGLNNIRDVGELLNALSADWQSLTAEEVNWEDKFPNPAFLGAWDEHRRLYEYTLRSELVYRLKQALQNRGDIELESSFKYLLVDEYQDLNRCDLAVIRSITAHGVESFVAGDDDQSIYGFRKAHPEGIRRFPQDYDNVTELALELCKRCDPNILDLGLFVARQDPRRIEKNIIAEAGRAPGNVTLLRFKSQSAEATGIASICMDLIQKHEITPGDILILLRTNRNSVLSNPIQEELRELEIPVVDVEDLVGLFDELSGRAFLSFWRLVVNRGDSLAWRTLLQAWCSNIGPGAISAISTCAAEHGESFAQTIERISEKDDIIPSRFRRRIVNAIDQIQRQYDELFPEELDGTLDDIETIKLLIEKTTERLVENSEERTRILSKIDDIIDDAESKTVESIVRAISADDRESELEREEHKVNILTMHRAKGLTAKAVIVAAAEDQSIPGIQQTGDGLGDERRLLYVSLTRAMHFLYITYCDRRIGPQQHTGRDSGNPYRSLTRFLRDCPIQPQDGQEYLEKLT